MHIYHFGYKPYDGHVMQNVSGYCDYEFERENPWGRQLDGVLAPGGKTRTIEIEGAAALHHKDGWTALAFWDRSGDKRFGSNSIFIADGAHTAEAMIALARQHFPKIMQRITFAIFVQQ